MRNHELFLGVGLGAGLMYLFDPARGTRRRALVRNQAVHAFHKIPDALSATGRDIRNRTRGLGAEARSMFSSAPVSDTVLVQRIRSKLGRIVSHPHAIEVKAENGNVTLAGPILTDEADNLIACVSAISGVSEVVDELEKHKQAGTLSALQGGRPRRNRSEFMQENWSPTARVGAGTAGAALIGHGLKTREPLCLLTGVIGLGLVARAVSNKPLKKVIGAGAGRSAVQLQKTINIDAPVNQVYDFWIDFQNFPLFMSNVYEVRTNNGKSHWVVAGPAGARVEWDALVTKQIPNELLAWKSEKGSAIESAGIIRFMPNEDDGTSLDIKLSYNPPAGAVGHMLASLLGSDPKTQMDEDLMRMKTLIETGNPPHDAAAARNYERS